MPSITTHFVHSENVYTKLSKKEQDYIKDYKNTYNTFTQSHDLLFYNLFNKKASKLGHYAHHHNTQEFIFNIIKEIKKNKLENNQEIIAFLYGIITHYSLDTVCHPYIFYKTGVYRKNEKWTHKYKGEHNHIEKDLDAIYYEKYFHRKYNKCNLNKEILKKTKLSNELIELINQVYEKTYSDKNIGIEMQKSIKGCRFINSVVVNDRFGIKRAIYLFIDTITKHKYGYMSSYSTHLLKPNIDWLNNEHKEWNHPCFKEKKYNDSFDSLFNKSVLKAIEIIKGVNEVLYNGKEFNSLKKIIPNDDYATGIECDNPNMLNYFEY